MCRAGKLVACSPTSPTSEEGGEKLASGGEQLFPAACNRFFFNASGEQGKNKKPTLDIFLLPTVSSEKWLRQLQASPAFWQMAQRLTLSPHTNLLWSFS